MMLGIISQRCALAVTVFGGGQHLRRTGRVRRGGDDEADHRLALGEREPAHAAGGTAHGAHFFFREARHLAGVAEQQDVALTVGQADTDQAIALLQIDGNDAARPGPREFHQRRLLDRAIRGRLEDESALREIAHRQDGLDLFAFLQIEQLDNGFAARLTARLRNLVDLEPVDPPTITEAEDVGVRAGDQQLVDKILFLHARGDLAAAATALGAVIGQRLRLDVTGVGQRDHHVLIDDQVLHLERDALRDNLAAALIAILLADGGQFFADHAHQPPRVGEDVEQIDDGLEDVAVLFAQLFLFQAGQAMQLEIEDRLRLNLGQPVALRGQPIGDGEPFGAGQLRIALGQQLRHDLGRPVARHHLLAGLFRILGGLDERDHLVDAFQRHRQAFQHMGAVA